MAKRKPSAKSSAAPVPQPHGGFLVPGAGGGPQPGSGRPPNVFKDFLGKLRSDPAFHAELEKAVKDSSSKGFSAALKLVTDYDDDKPAEKRQIGGKLELTVRIEREGRRTS